MSKKLSVILLFLVFSTIVQSKSLKLQVQDSDESDILQKAVADELELEEELEDSVEEVEDELEDLQDDIEDSFLIQKSFLRRMTQSNDTSSTDSSSTDSSSTDSSSTDSSSTDSESSLDLNSTDTSSSTSDLSRVYLFNQKNERPKAQRKMKRGVRKHKRVYNRVR